MHRLSKRFSFLAMTLLSQAAQAERSPEPEVQPLHRSPACYTANAAKTEDADRFYLAGESDVDLANSPVTIESDYAEYYEDGRLKLEGSVEIQRPGYRARSDSARIDQQSGEAELSGDIEILSPGMEVRGKDARLDMDANRAEVHQAEFLNPDTRMRGGAETIRQVDANQVQIINGSFTTCEPDDRSWAIRASEINLDQEGGFGEAYHTRFEILDVPVLYLPWFTFPIDDRRKSGFLYPAIGSSNAGSGLFFSAPYYFNIAPQFDATYTPSSIHGRGFHSELELRHLSRVSETELGLAYIKRDDAFLDEEQRLRNPAEDGERWALSFEQELNFYAYGSPWAGSIDFSDISDEDYLEDLNQGLRIENQDHLDRRARFTYAQPFWQVDVQLQQYLNIDRDLPANEEAFQRLPEINYRAFQTVAGLELDWQSQYVYFYRDADDLTGLDKAHGSRLRHTPKLSLPWHRSWGYLKPSLLLDHTDYELRDYAPVDNHVARTIPFYELDAGLYLDRKVDYFGQSYINSLEPRAYYVYSAFEAQDDLPNFDSSIPAFNYQRLFQAHRFSGGDRVGDNNRLTLGFTSRWTDWESGLDRFVWSLGQVIHFSDREVEIDGLGASEKKDSQLATEFLYRPLENLEVGVAGLWNARDESTEEGVSRISYRAGQGGAVFNLSHRYRADELEQSDVSVILPVRQSISLLGRWRYDLTSNRSIGSILGFEYNSCCWRMQFLSQQYLTDESEIGQSFLLRFQLVGLGGFGADPDALDREIPGYKAREEFFE